METTTRNEEIRRKRQEGVSLAEIGREFGLSRQRILQIAPDARPLDKKKADRAIKAALKAAEDIEASRQAMSESAERRADAIREALAAGMTQADVARALDVGFSAINGALRKH